VLVPLLCGPPFIPFHFSFGDPVFGAEFSIYFLVVFPVCAHWAPGCTFFCVEGFLLQRGRRFVQSPAFSWN